MQKALFGILTLILIYSCEDRREFEVNDFEKEIVLNAIISTDSIWNINLSYTKSIFDDTDFEQINNASVKIKDLSNGQSFFLDTKKTGNYTRDLNPVEGHEYEINVNIPSRQEIHAITYVPSVLEVDVVSNLVIDENGNENIEIGLEITDNPNEENYYVWELLEVDPKYFNETKAAPISTKYEEEPVDNVTPEDPIDTDGGGINPGNIGNTNGTLTAGDIFSFNTLQDDSEYQSKSLNDPSFFSESDVKAGKIANKLILASSLISSINDNYVINESGTIEEERVPLFELKIMAVSSDLYDYLRTYQQYKRSEIINSSFADPIIIHSNIRNGLGIFGGYNLKSFYIY